MSPGDSFDARIPIRLIGRYANLIYTYSGMLFNGSEKVDGRARHHQQPDGLRSSKG
jgi:hypothetical protein